MAGVLFIINVPRREYELELRNKEKSTHSVERECNQYEQTSKIIDALKERKLNIGKSHDDVNISMSKCKSTDCLHINDTRSISRSKSENMLCGLDENKSCASWVKQVIHPWKSKLTITAPDSGADILAAFQNDKPMETMVSEVIVRLNIKSAAWSSTKDDKFWKVIFSLESGNQCEELLQVLRTFGIGSRYQSSISVIPCALYYKDNNEDHGEASNIAGLENGSNSAWSRFSSSVRARNNLAQVLHDVRAEAALTFDWLFLLIVAAFVAAIGLVENSTVILVASMLISPLMGPITAGTLGTAVRDRSLQQMGVVHELFGLFLSLVIGFVFGLAICAVDEKYGVGDWPTYEMMSRCEIRSLWVGVLVAIPSGAGVALAVLGEYTASLVGVAISASLLPPAVNAGLLWAMALVHCVYKDDNSRWTSVVKTTIYSQNQPTELAVLGAVSLCLTLVNIICIFLAGVAVYKIKEVCPFERRNIYWWRTNKSFMYSSQRKHDKDSTRKAVWDIYSNWCNEMQDNEDTQSKKPPSGLVHSDTVTYRRHHPLTQRIKAHRITDKLSLRRDPDIDFNQTANSINREELGNNNSIVMKDRSSLTASSVCCYDSLENGNSNFRNSLDRPTIEPSLSLTVDAKKSGIVLNSVRRLSECGT